MATVGKPGTASKGYYGNLRKVNTMELVKQWAAAHNYHLQEYDYSMPLLIKGKDSISIDLAGLVKVTEYNGELNLFYSGHKVRLHGNNVEVETKV